MLCCRKEKPGYQYPSISSTSLLTTLPFQRLSLPPSCVHCNSSPHTPYSTMVTPKNILAIGDPPLRPESQAPALQAPAAHVEDFGDDGVGVHLFTTHRQSLSLYSQIKRVNTSSKSMIKPRSQEISSGAKTPADSVSVRHNNNNNNHSNQSNHHHHPVPERKTEGRGKEATQHNIHDARHGNPPS